MTIPIPRYKIGDTVWYGTAHKTRKSHDCPDCLGTKQWTVTTPAGATLQAECQRCSTGYSSLRDVPSLHYCEYAPEVRRMTIGSVRVDTAETRDSPISYMCVETGVGSGAIYYETKLSPDEAGARALAEVACAIQNEPLAKTPERIEQRHLSSLQVRDAMFTAAERAIWHGWYSYNRLRDEIADALEGAPEEIREAVSDVLRWENDGREGPPIAQLLAAVRPALDGRTEVLRKVFEQFKDLVPREPIEEAA